MSEFVCHASGRCCIRRAPLLTGYCEAGSLCAVAEASCADWQACTKLCRQYADGPLDFKCFSLSLSLPAWSQYKSNWKYKSKSNLPLLENLSNNSRNLNVVAFNVVANDSRSRGNCLLCSSLLFGQKVRPIIISVLIVMVKGKLISDSTPTF